MPVGGKRTSKPFRLQLLPGVWILALAACAAACNAMGSHALKKSHRRFEQGLAELRGHELLLNIVQFRYRDLIAFLDVSSITANYNLGATLGGNVPLGNPGSYAGNLVPLSAGIQTQENPTITFSPLHGSQFVKRMCTPLNIETLFLLANSGWSVDRILLLTLAGANGLNNASQTFDRNLYEQDAGAAEFYRLAKLLDRLTLEQKLTWQFREEGDAAGRTPPRAFLLTFEAPGDPDTREAKQLLKLPPGQNRFYVYYDNIFHETGREEPPIHEILVMTRSMNQVLFYLSNGVQVPEKHIEQGLVKTASTEGVDRASDWHELSAQIFRVHCSSMPPADAYLAVKHRGHWYYVRDDDLESKVTLLLVQILIDLQAGGAPPQTPVLTLPVSR